MPIIDFPKYSISLKVTKILNTISHIPGSKMDSILYPWKKKWQKSSIPKTPMQSKKEGKVRNRYNQVPHLTQDTNDPQNKYRLGTVSKNILLEGLNRFHGANLTLSSDVDQNT